MEEKKGKPKRKVTWWAFGIAVLSAALLIAMIIIFHINFTRTIDLFNVVTNIMYISAAAAILAFGLSLNALSKKERSWTVWTALGVSVVMSAFWLYTVLGGDFSILLFLLS